MQRKKQLAHILIFSVVLSLCYQIHAIAQWVPPPSGVSQIIAGTNITISPASGTGAVTINASGGGGSGTVTSVSTTTTPSWLTSTWATATTTPAQTIASATGLTSHEVLGTFTDGTITLAALTAADLPSGTVTNPMTTEGDMIGGGVSGVPTRLPVGNLGQPMLSQGAGAIPKFADKQIMPNITAFQPRTFKALEINYDGSTTFTGINTSPGNITGTASAALATDGTGMYINYATAITSGAAATISCNANGGGGAVSNYQNARDIFNFKTGTASTDITNCRIWVAVVNSSNMSAMSGSDNPSAAYVACRYSTAVDGTAFFRIVTNTGSAQNVTTTTVPVVAGTPYTFSVDESAGPASPIVVYLTGDGVSYSLSTSTDIPPAGTGMFSGISITNTAATPVVAEDLLLKSWFHDEL